MLQTFYKISHSPHVEHINDPVLEN